MDDQNIPEEELSYSTFNVGDITKTVNSAKSNILDSDETDEIEELTNSVLTAEEIGTHTKEYAVETETETETEEEDAPKAQPSPYSDEVYQAAMQLVQENGLLTIPEEIDGEITDEAWQSLLQQNEYMREQRALENIRNRAGDPKIVELLDYVMEGGDWYGYEQMKTVIQDEIDISTLDTNNEQDQRYLIELFLSDGLDPDNPAHAMRLRNIENDIELVFDRLENDEMAESAKQHLMVQVNEEKARVEQQKQEYLQYQYEQERRTQQAKQNWNNEFKNSLNSRAWDQSKKEEIVSQFDVVQLSDGSEMEMWQYKFDAIWRDPQATQVFMDFMSDFDPTTLQFKRKGVPINKQVSSTIKRLINSKAQASNSNRHATSRRAPGTNTPKIDPNQY